MKKRKLIYCIPFLSAFVFLSIYGFQFFNDKESTSLFSAMKTSSVLYRWQDEQGQWHFSDSPPEQQLESKADLLPELVNVLPAAEISTNNPKHTAKKPRIALPSTINPANIPKLIEQAKDVQGLMDQRNQQIDKALQR